MMFYGQSPIHDYLRKNRWSGHSSTLEKQLQISFREV
jgi:hypothetical protein